jgi:hypothetical protein
MATSDIGPARNRDDEMRPGDPPRSAHEPPGGEGSARNPKTLTDPATGEPQKGPPKPAASHRED